MSRPKRDITPEESAQVEALAAHGHTQEEIARFLGISYRGLQGKIKENEPLFASYSKGRFKAKNYVMSRLMRYIRNDELNAINLNAIQFYLRNSGFGVESKNDNNKVQISFDKTSPVEIFNSGLNAFKEGKIDFTQMQQIGNLALTKMNIENQAPQEDKTAYEQRNRKEALEFAMKMKDAKETLQLIKENSIKPNIKKN